MELQNLPLVIVICLGHSGSRLLTRILDDSGIYMGRYRGRNGDDDQTWSGWSNEIRRAFLRYELQGDSEPLISLLRTNFFSFQKLTFDPPLLYRFRQQIKRGVYAHRPPRRIRGYGFKKGMSSTFFAKPFCEMLRAENLEHRTYFIHLTRGLGSWLRSGYAQGTKGVPRPIFLPYANHFPDDFIKYLWFGSTNRYLELPDGRKIDLLTVSEDELIKNREYLESLFWANSQLRCVKLRSIATNYLHVRLEDILKRPVEVSTAMSDFLGVDVRINQRLDTSRVAFSHQIPENVSLLAREVSSQLGY